MKQLGKYKEDIKRFAIIFPAVISALILFWQTRTLGSVILSFIVFAVLVIVLLKFI
jgi:hypothetical protein